MSYLINLYNQTGAGPKNISLNLINELSKIQNNIKYWVIVPNTEQYAALQSAGDVQLIKLPKFQSILKKIFYRVYLDLVLIPKIVNRYQVDSFLAFGNYLVSPLKIKKTVLLHHPYLFDDGLLRRLPFVKRIIEKFRRVVFWLTLKNVNNVVVQSNYVQKEFKKKWTKYNGKVAVIPNPISNNFFKQSKKEFIELVNKRINTLNQEVNLLYVSRFYPHKNHAFLIEISAELTRRNIKHTIFVTVDKTIQGAGKFLQNAADQDSQIVNIGEVDQQILHEHYKSAHALIFVSESETFGNPLIEAMGYGLPIVVPDLGYAKSIVGKDGIYFSECNTQDCVDKISSLQQQNYYRLKSDAMYQRFDLFPDTKEWVKKYLLLINEATK